MGNFREEGNGLFIAARECRDSSLMDWPTGRVEIPILYTICSGKNIARCSIVILNHMGLRQESQFSAFKSAYQCCCCRGDFFFPDCIITTTLTPRCCDTFLDQNRVEFGFLRQIWLKASRRFKLSRCEFRKISATFSSVFYKRHINDFSKYYTFYSRPIWPNRFFIFVLIYVAKIY